MKRDRRNFIKIAGTALGGMLIIPEFLSAIPLSDFEVRSGTEEIDNIIVVLQLSGGNDGLNTFIPYGDPMYYQLRGELAIPKDNVLKVNREMGLHPSLSGLNDILQAGGMSVIQNVGYPNPDRSHFRSMEIWQTGSASSEYLSTGWLGRYMDATCSKEDVLAGLNIDGMDSLALQGLDEHSISLRNPELFEKQIKGMNEQIESTVDINDNLAYVRKLSASAFKGSDLVKKALEKSAAYPVNYPDSGIGNNLHWISRMIKGGLQSKVYYTSFGGFDTHANQLNVHSTKLSQVSEAIKTFYTDMQKSGLDKRVTLMVFSEFGRRVEVNGSKGTDHGKAAPLFIIGGNNRGAISGHNPDLNKLDDGDLRFEYDFRRIYAELLRKKLHTDPSSIGLTGYQAMDLFK